MDGFEILVGSDGGGNVGTVLFIQGGVNDRTVLQGHLWLAERKGKLKLFSAPDRAEGNWSSG